MFIWEQFFRLPVEKQETVLKFVILTIACILSFSVRLFSVLRFESVIHEFDPYFNYRTTKFLVEEGFYNFHDWFDDAAWYPLGRIIGGTIYPGLMITTAVIYNTLQFLNITLDIRNVCVFLAPLFSSFTTIVTYLLTKELKNSGAGLVAAAFISITPGYISRSVAGSYDNEAIAIFCMLLTYYGWVKSVKTGSISWSVFTALAYFYMVSSWGGYVFLINLIPLHVLILMITGRFSHRIYIAYNIVYCLGTLLSMQISFVGFQPVQSSEHMLALGVFGLCQIIGFADYLNSRLTGEEFQVLYKTFIACSMVIIIGIGAILTLTGKIAPWTGRFYTLLDPSYAKNHIPIIASVSEHQPTSWSSFFFDLQALVFLFPAGLYFCFDQLTDANIFLILYGMTSVYFAGVMVRLMLVLAPVMCILSGVAVTSVFSVLIRVASSKPDQLFEQKKTKRSGTHVSKRFYTIRSKVASFLICLLALMLGSYNFHCIWTSSEAYSSPSIVLSANTNDGHRVIFDDFREAYSWLRHNTPENSRIMSWWDYGYQITAMGKRTVIVDNNTWNNTHISRVGQAFAFNETKSYEIMSELDVNYVLVIFGGLIGYSSDDINKFLWMVRIGASTEHGRSIKESDYYASNGEFRIDNKAPPTFLNSFMYKLCYYQFGTVRSEGDKGQGYDRVRSAVVGVPKIHLEHVEEAYTSEHWLVRIYKVKPPNNRGV